MGTQDQEHKEVTTKDTQEENGIKEDKEEGVLKKRWMILLVFLVGAGLLMAASPIQENYGGKTFTLAATDSVLVRWANDVRTYIHTGDYAQASFTFRLYTTSVDSLIIRFLTTDFPPTGGTDSVDVPDYYEIYRDTIAGTGTVGVTLGKTQATSFGQYIAIQLISIDAGTIDLGESHKFRLAR